MKRFYWINLLLACVFMLVACDDDENTGFGPEGVRIETPQIVEMTDAGATISAAFSIQEGVRYTGIGFCYSTDSEPTIYDSAVKGTVSNGTVTAILNTSELPAICYVRAFICIYNGATVYSEATLVGGDEQLLNYQAPTYPDDYTSIAGWESRDQWNLANVHDPSVMKADDGYYYMYQTDASYGNAHEAGGHFHCRRSQNLVDLYEMKTTGEKFDWANPMHAQNPYYNRDPRLDYTVFRNESQFNNKGVLEIYEGGANGKGVPNATGTGYYIRKFTDETLDLVQNRTSVHTWVFFRLAEMYLNYAEALNECEPGNPDILIYANKTRERVGVEMPPITETDQAAVRERIRNERSVELAFEGHRLWDVRRWMTAMDVLNQPLRGVSCTYEDYEYKYSVIEVEKRVFKPEMYFYPIPQSLLYTTGNKWVQNPGWGI